MYGLCIQTFLRPVRHLPKSPARRGPNKVTAKFPAGGCPTWYFTSPPLYIVALEGRLVSTA